MIPGLSLAACMLCMFSALPKVSAESTWGFPAFEIIDLQTHPKIADLSAQRISSYVTSSADTFNLIPEDALQHRETPKAIIIMGGPASGKGTQCERIAAHYDLIHLSTGDMLRDHVARHSSSGVGAVAKAHMNDGKLVPDDVIIEIVMRRISQPDCTEKGWLLDGFPRTPAQAQALLSKGIAVDLFLFLSVPDDELMNRVLGRRIDPETGKIYHLMFRPPPEDVLDRLVQRGDDTEEKMRNRLAQFHANVGSVRRFFENVLVEINGSGHPDSVTDQIVDAIRLGATNVTDRIIAQ